MKSDKGKKRNQEDILEGEEVEEKEEKKGKPNRKASVEKRKKAKEMDRAARWSGFVLLIIMMFVGFLLWVAGEMKTELP